jgi:arabinose-5-phosphate isomerase
VLVTGLGKSGLIGGKIAATLSSLGVPAHSVHPSEAAHGDLGRFRSCDTVIALSFSGETDEVVGLAAILHQDGLPIISITGGERGDENSLVRLSTVALRLGRIEEAGDGHFVAPTSSTAATLALGDALALAVARQRRFTDAEFAKRHPGGALGGLLRPVVDVMRFRVGKNLKVAPDSSTVYEALTTPEGRRPGAILLTGDDGRLTGILTDADVRRLALDPDNHWEACMRRPVKDFMTRHPRGLSDIALVRDAVTLVREHRIDEIPIVDGEGRPVGLLDVQDLIAMRLVTDG